MPSNTLREEYSRAADERRLTATEAEKRFGRIGSLRLLAGLTAAVMAFFVFGSAGLSPFWLILPIGAFAVLVVIHARVVQELEHARRALRFYEQGLARVEDRWMGTGNPGERFRDPKHVYAEDLDLFGKGSLYELLCTARTRAGEDTLAAWLTAPATLADAAGRQAAVEELAGRVELRETLALIGEEVRAGLHPEALAAWSEGPAVRFPSWLPVFAAVLSTATILALAGYLTGWSGRIPLLCLILIQLSTAYVFRPKVRDVLEGAELPSRDLALLSQLLERLEAEPATSAYLRSLQDRLRTGGLLASQQIAHLQRLATRLDWQHNEFFRPLAAMLMWSTQLSVAIEKWRQRSGGSIRAWIVAAGEFEALCALAGYRHEHPEDVFPELRDTGPLYDGEGLGHPLLARQNSVTNDVRLGSGLPLIVVSGSNMSGKSTLLRTVGLNAVLAWAGAPVRARRLAVSRLQIGASMRVQDSLQDGKSRFYAEITRLRQLVELTAGGEPVLFLLDELLSGTNSHDRRIGAAAIVKGLVERGAIGLLTTHDLALAHIAEMVSPPGVNVHFADTLENGRLSFDYKLAAGVVERSNALELMRSVGLEV